MTWVSFILKHSFGWVLYRFSEYFKLTFNISLGYANSGHIVGWQGPWRKLRSFVWHCWANQKPSADDVCLDVYSFRCCRQAAIFPVIHFNVFILCFGTLDIIYDAENWTRRSDLDTKAEAHAKLSRGTSWICRPKNVDPRNQNSLHKCVRVFAVSKSPWIFVQKQPPQQMQPNFLNTKMSVSYYIRNHTAAVVG